MDFRALSTDEEVAFYLTSLKHAHDHNQEHERARVAVACASCKRLKAKCGPQRPCGRCVRLGRADSCTDSVHQKKPVPKRGHGDAHADDASSVERDSSPSDQERSVGSSDDLAVPAESPAHHNEPAVASSKRSKVVRSPQQESPASAHVIRAQPTGAAHSPVTAVSVGPVAAVSPLQAPMMARVYQPPTQQFASFSADTMEAYLLAMWRMQQHAQQQQHQQQQQQQLCMPAFNLTAPVAPPVWPPASASPAHVLFPSISSGGGVAAPSAAAKAEFPWLMCPSN